jgi:hypothetical protein
VLLLLLLLLLLLHTPLFPSHTLSHTLSFDGARRPMRGMLV